MGNVDDLAFSPRSSQELQRCLAGPQRRIIRTGRPWVDDARSIFAGTCRRSSGRFGGERGAVASVVQRRLGEVIATRQPLGRPIMGRLSVVATVSLCWQSITIT